MSDSIYTLNMNEMEAKLDKFLAKYRENDPVTISQDELGALFSFSASFLFLEMLKEGSQEAMDGMMEALEVLEDKDND